VPERSTPRLRSGFTFPRALPRTIPGSVRALGEWLGGFQWTHWATLTFGKSWGPTGPAPQRASVHVGRFLTDQCEGCPGYFFCIEEGRFGRVHAHALLRFDQYGIRGFDIDPGRLADAEWGRRFGRARFRPYDGKLGAAHYCAKYITKAPLTWDVGRLTIGA